MMAASGMKLVNALSLKRDPHESRVDLARLRGFDEPVMLNVMGQEGSERLILQAFQQLLPTPGVQESRANQIVVVACKRGRHRAVSIGELAALWRGHLVGPTAVRHFGDWEPADASAEIAAMMEWLGQAVEEKPYASPPTWMELHQPLWPGVLGLPRRVQGRQRDAYETAIDLVFKTWAQPTAPREQTAAPREQTTAPRERTAAPRERTPVPREQAARRSGSQTPPPRAGRSRKSCSRGPTSSEPQPQIPQSPSGGPGRGMKRPRSPSGGPRQGMRRPRSPSQESGDWRPRPTTPRCKQGKNREHESPEDKAARKAWSWQCKHGEQPRTYTPESDSDCVSDLPRPPRLDQYPFLNRADSIMAGLDVSKKGAERFWGFYAEAGNSKNTLWHMNQIMRKLERTKPRVATQWLTTAICDRLVEVVEDIALFRRPIPAWFMDHAQWNSEQDRLTRRWTWKAK